MGTWHNWPGYTVLGALALVHGPDLLPWYTGLVYCLGTRTWSTALVRGPWYIGLGTLRHWPWYTETLALGHQTWDTETLALGHQTWDTETPAWPAERTSLAWPCLEFLPDWR